MGAQALEEIRATEHTSRSWEQPATRSGAVWGAPDLAAAACPGRETLGQARASGKEHSFFVVLSGG